MNEEKTQDTFSLHSYSLESHMVLDCMVTAWKGIWIEHNTAEQTVEIISASG